MYGIRKFTKNVCQVLYSIVAGFFKMDIEAYLKVDLFCTMFNICLKTQPKVVVP
jgi:hypothetical protein